MLKRMPLILLGMILFLGLAHHWISLEVKSFLLGISASLKSLILFCLPVVIFGLLFKTAAQMARSASKIILFLLVAITFSNFISTILSYFVGTLAYQFDLSITFPDEMTPLTPLFALQLPQWISNDIAMFSGVILGLTLGLVKPRIASLLSKKMEQIITRFLRVFLTMIPLFIAGFVVKMYHDQVMTFIVRDYSFIFALIMGALLIYISFLYLVVSKFQKDRFFYSIKNMFPAALTGFGSMSSAAAMPLTLLGTEKNSDDPELAKSVIPATVNVHLIGDCFAIPILAFAILKGFQVPEPSFYTYLIFAIYFVIAKFSVAGVPAGGILIMLPILEERLGFSGEMLSLITALYILLDPLITASNIFGNGGFAVGFSNLFQSKKMVKL